MAGFGRAAASNWNTDKALQIAPHREGPSVAKKRTTKKKKKTSSRRAGSARSKRSPTKKKTSTASRSTRSTKKKRKSARTSAAGTKRSSKKKAAARKKKSKKKSAARSTSTRKKKTSKKTSRKSSAKSSKKKTSAAASKKKSASKKKTSKKKTSKKSSGKSKSQSNGSAGSGSKKTYSVAEAAANAKADAQGYVFINGRRVRMISSKAAPAASKKTNSRTKSKAAASQPEKPKIGKTKLTRKELNHYKKLLLEKRRELVGDLGTIEQEALRNVGGGTHMPIHMADIGSDTYDQDFMLGLAENERKQLREIDEALMRIKNGTYGVCLMTGKQIPAARLEAKPWAKYTIEAARQIEGGYST